jgi:PAS domain-containing protein
MNAVLQDEDKLAPAGGQTVRLPGSSRSVSLHEQLYRYADDLQLMIERNSELAADNDELRESSERLLESREELDAIMQSSLDIHLITDAAGSILQSNPAGRSLAPAEKLEHSNLADWVEAAHMGDFVALHSNALRGNHGPEQGVELHLHREDNAAPAADRHRPGAGRTAWRKPAPPALDPARCHLPARDRIRNPHRFHGVQERHRRRDDHRRRRRNPRRQYRLHHHHRLQRQRSARSPTGISSPPAIMARISTKPSGSPCAPPAPGRACCSIGDAMAKPIPNA